MRAIILFFLSTTFIFNTKAQTPARATPDTFSTTRGTLTIQPIVHASLVLSVPGLTIYADPTGGAANYTGIKAPDLILITDIHGDHLDAKTISAVRTAATTLVVPRAVADLLPDSLKSKVVILNNGDKTALSGITITALPMYNLPESPQSRHTKGRGNGYILSIGEKNIYLSGDTQGIPEMRSLKDIDVAFVCMNLPYTMDINEAADAVLAFKPRIVYPYHYRGQGGLSDVDGFKKLVEAGNKNIEVRLRNWYPSK
jgi:L-ascorbate metabolism protein UlaG (beta-lactamase superfamily)